MTVQVCAPPVDGLNVRTRFAGLLRFTFDVMSIENGVPTLLGHEIERSTCTLVVDDKVKLTMWWTA